MWFVTSSYKSLLNPYVRTVWKNSSGETSEYYNYGTQEDGSVMVAGGGMMNGNAYATVEKRNDKYYYCEFGKCPFNIYIGDIIDWSEERRDGCGGFNINSSPSTVCKHSRVDGFPHDVGDCDCGGYIEECPNCLDKVKCSHCGLCGGCGGGKMFSDSDSSDSDEEDEYEPDWRDAFSKWGHNDGSSTRIITGDVVDEIEALGYDCCGNEDTEHYDSKEDYHEGWGCHNCSVITKIVKSDTGEVVYPIEGFEVGGYDSRDYSEVLPNDIYEAIKLIQYQNWRE